MTRKIEVVVYEKNNYNSSHISNNAIEFIKFFQNKLNLVPDEYKEEAEIEIEPELYYDDSTSLSVKITYWRSETKEDIDRRVQKIEKENEECILKEIEEFKRLYNKLGPEIIKNIHGTTNEQ